MSDQKQETTGEPERDPNAAEPDTGRAGAEQRALEAIYLPARTEDKSELALIEKSDRPVTIVRDWTVVWAFMALFIGFGGFVAWASLVKLSQGVFAQGQVAVDTQRKTVQHLEGGIIQNIYIREGDMVEAGQVLIELEGVQSRSRRDQIVKRLGALTATLDRLKAEQANNGSLAFTDLTGLGLSQSEEAEIFGQQRELYVDRLDQLQGAKDLLVKRMARFEELVAEEGEARRETTELFIPTGERLGEKVIEINNLSKGFGDRLLIDDFSAIIPRGAIVGIIGGNGAGKSTFFKMLTGQEQPDSGSIDKGATVELAYVDQSRDALADDKTVWEEISDGLDIIRVGKHEIASRQYCGRFNFKGTDQQKFVGNLSGGERNRVHLAKLLRRGANVLLLDEPTNDLDVETLRALEEALLSYAGTALVISHDRWFLDRVATHIIAFTGDSDVTFFEGNYTEYEADRKKRLGDAQPTRVKYKPIHR